MPSTDARVLIAQQDHHIEAADALLLGLSDTAARGGSERRSDVEHVLATRALAHATLAAMFGAERAAVRLARS